MKTQPYENVMRVVRSIAGVWKGARERRAALDELDCCGRSEIERIAGDLNLTAAELKDLASHGSDLADLLYRRLTALGIDPARIDRVILRDLQRTCSCCDNKSECREELDQQPHAANEASEQRGRRFALTHCASCHSIDKVTPSPLAIAPPFRNLHRLYPVETLQETLAEGIVTGHPSMPEFRLEADQITDFIAFLKSLER